MQEHPTPHGSTERQVEGLHKDQVDHTVVHPGSGSLAANQHKVRSIQIIIIIIIIITLFKCQEE